MDYKSVNAANDLLSNGILVETGKGLVCLSLNDALSSTDINLSVETLQNVAAQLLLQDDNPSVRKPSSNPPSCTLLFPDSCYTESDGFTSESSEPNINLQAKLPSTLIPLKSTNTENDAIFTNTSEVGTEFLSTSSQSNEKMILDGKELTMDSAKVVKKRGGWPKGRKRKPELLHLPPKAPATGYNLYLNDQRKLYKESPLPFHEITKLIGNRWSSLSLAEKKPYLDKAEEEKKRYREEFRVYRQSGAYQLYLANKRRKRAKYNVLSESDMDATDDLDDEDNEELYCRTCDQWFHNLHNKREHLQGRQHMQAIAGAIRSELESSDYETDGGFAFGNTSSMSMSTSLDESSMDAAFITSSNWEPATKANVRTTVGESNATDIGPSNADSTDMTDRTTTFGNISSAVPNVTESIKNLMAVIGSRESEIKSLQSVLVQNKELNNNLYKLCSQLKDKEARLRRDLSNLKKEETRMEAEVFHLWQLPSWFVINLKLEN